MFNATQRYISVDPESGKGAFKIPLAKLYLDQGRNWDFDLNLTSDAEDVDMGFFSSGTAHYVPGSGAFTGHSFLSSISLVLHDGRKITLAQEFLGRVLSDGYLVDLTWVELEKYVTVYHKNGAVEIFDIPYKVEAGGILPAFSGRYHVVRIFYIAPSGRYLKFGWELFGKNPKVVSIDDNDGRVMTATWGQRSGNEFYELKKVVVFPGSDEVVTYSSSYKDTVFTLEGSGAGILGKLRYKIKTGSGTNADASGSIYVEHAASRLESLDVEIVSNTSETTEEISKCSECLAYKDEKISQLTIELGGGVEKRTEDYVYTAGKTSVNIKQGDHSSVCEYIFKEGVKVSDSTTINGVVSVSEQNIVADEARGVIVVTRTQKVGGDVTSLTEMEYDTGGNLIKSIEGDRVVEFTYYNNYQAYTVKEEKVYVYDTSFWGVLFKPMDYSFGALPSLIAGNHSGFTWGSEIVTKVTMSASANDYAKNAFNLPIDVKYPGDVRGFATHLESMLVYRKVGENKHPVSLTYFGYEKFTPATIELNGKAHVVREHIALPSVKLTVLSPSYVEADVSDQQLEVANKAAKDFFVSLEEQKKASTDKEAQKQYQTAIDDLKKSLVAQSKVNARGFKLGDWASGMQVETQSYHTDSKKPGFGELKSTSLHLLDANGKEIANSKVTTTFDYSVDTTDKRKLTVKSTVTTPDKLSVSTSLSRSTLGGRIFETIDGEGVKAVHTYKNGMTEKVTVTQGTVTIDETTQEVTALKDRLFQFQSYSSRAGDHTRVVRDALGREVEHSLSTDGETWLKMSASEYDSSGRAKSLAEYDYDAAGKKTSTRLTSWAYAANKCTATLVLKDAADKETDRRTQVLEKTANGHSLTLNTFKVERAYDHAKKTLTEDFGGVFKIRQSFDDGGLMKSISYLTLGSDKKEVEQDSLTFEYNPMGQIASFAPKHSGTSTYTYDVFGRLLKSDAQGTEIRNVYSAATLSGVATEGFAKDATGEFALGTQTVDGLGRTSSQTLNGDKTDFTYKGSSHWAKCSGTLTGPAVLPGYSSELTASSLTYSESVTQNNVTHKSTSTHSRRSTVLKFEGIRGGETTYGYDVLGRLIKSTNASCEATFEYGDNSLLTKETIKGVKNNLTMTVTFTYNSMGEETSRKFECTGFDTIECDRELLGDGRLSKGTFKIAGKEHRSDSYTYDNCNRLKAWSCTGEGVRNHEGKCYVSESFGYDALGNVLTRENLSYTSATRPTKLDSTSSAYKYDPKKPGAITASGSTAMVEDAQGRLIKRANRNITYHANGQVNTYSATPGGDGDNYVFAYDDMGRVRGGTVGKFNEIYHYRGSQIYAVVQTDTEKKYGFHGRQLVLQNDSPSCWLQDVVTKIDKTETSKCTFELRDAAGTVFASLDLESKTVTWFVYSPFGYRNPDPKSVTWRGFKGDPLNMLSLYYLGSYRLYDPQQHRFQTPDCRSPFGVGGVSRYAFCGCDPVNNHDPSGHQLVAQYSRLNGSPWIYSDAFRISIAVIGVFLAPITGGASLGFAIAATGLAIASLGFEIASICLRESDPKLAQIMGGLGLACGLASMGVSTVGAKLARVSTASRIGAAGRYAYKGSDAASIMAETIGQEVERINPNLVGPDHVVLGQSQGTAFELYSAGPQSERLVISAHGTPVEGLSFGGPNNPIPEYFTATNADRVGFYADQGFKVHMQGHNYYDVLSGAYTPSNYYLPQKVPNYLLTEFTTAEHVQEIPALGKIPNFNASSTLGQMAQTMNVDFLRPIQPVTLEQVFSALEKAGYRYKVIDGLHCRGAISPGTSPSLVQTGLHNMYKGLDWWKGVRMVP